MPVISTNRKAYYLYHILETYEAGIQLEGWEVKSIRNHRISLKDSFVKIAGREVLLINAYIPPYQKARPGLTNTRRTRKLLLKKETIRHLESKTRSKNLTIVPLKVYTKRNLVKVEIALAKGKKKFEKKREAKKTDLHRQIEAEIKESLQAGY